MGGVWCFGNLVGYENSYVGSGVKNCYLILINCGDWFNGVMGNVFVLG